jgi:hypothetical protein
MDEEWVYIILASKVFNTFCHFKLEAKIILDVGGHHSRPIATIIFSIHVVHLSQISIFIRNRREFKDNVLVKAWWKILHFLNCSPNLSTHLWNVGCEKKIGDNK